MNAEIKIINKNWYIDNLGNIYDKNMNKITLKKNSDGYYAKRMVGAESELIHRIVYAKFVGDLLEGHVIDHIDRNKENNSVDNLRQVDYSGNALNRSSLSQMFVINIITKKTYITDNVKLLEGVEETIFKSSYLKKCLKGTMVQYNGWTAVEVPYENTVGKFNFYEEISFDSIPVTIVLPKPNNKKTIVVCSPTNSNNSDKEIYVVSNKKLLETKGFSVGSVLKVLNKKHTSHNNYYFEYRYDISPVDNDVILTFGSMIEFNDYFFGR